MWGPTPTRQHGTAVTLGFSVRGHSYVLHFWHDQRPQALYALLNWTMNPGTSLEMDDAKRMAKVVKENTEPV